MVIVKPSVSPACPFQVIIPKVRFGMIDVDDYPLSEHQPRVTNRHQEAPTAFFKITFVTFKLFATILFKMT